jgi:tetratricopeptide (TPR) repeat protein
MNADLVLAVQYHSVGRLDDAERLYTQLHRSNPTDPEIIFLLGLLCCDLGLFDAACRFLEDALAIAPAFPEARRQLALARNQLGRAALLRGDAVAAEQCFQASLDGDADAQTHNLLGLAQLQQEKFAVAEASLRRALEFAPGNNQARNNLGLALVGQGHHEAGRLCFETALALDPSYVSARINLADSLRMLGELDAAREALETVVVAQPDSVEALNNLGAVAQDQGDTARALACLSRALVLAPDAPRIRWNLALSQLHVGDFNNGWRNFEARWEGCSHLRGGYALPRERAWTGEPLQGKRVLLWAEQGFGDTLQFIRFARDIEARGARVSVLVQPQLAGVLRGVAGVHELIAQGCPLPDYDLHCPLMSLPHRLAVRPDREALHGDAPYLSADADQVRVWQQRLRGYAGLKVGLVWAGSSRRGSIELAAIDARRSMSLERILPLLGVGGCHFFSLQKDDSPRELPAAIQDFTAEWTDFSATAAFIACLDLVISVDTAVAHLAGALGKPLWLLNRYDSCWRWLQARDDSPWYATVRQFRQPAPGAWEAVIAATAAELASAAVNPR